MKRLARLPAIGAAALALAGCALLGESQADRTRTDVLATPGPLLDPAELARQLAPVPPTTPSATAAIETPLTLPNAVALARETSERIRESGEQLHQAYLLRVEAVSELLPKLRFRSLYFREENDFPSFGVGGTQFILDEQRTSRFELKQPLVNVGSYLALTQSRSVIDTAEARLRAARLFVEQTTSDAFIAALAAERTVATFESALARDEERLREVEDRARSGLARRTEVLFVATDLARTKSSLARAREDRASTRERLALLLGRPVRGELVEPPDRLAPHGLADRPLPSLIEQAYAERPDLRALREEVEVQVGAVRVAIGGYIPTLDFTGNWYTHRDGTLEDVDWDVALELTAPIFEGFLTTARVREAQSRMREARLAFEGFAREVAAEVTSAWHDLRASSAALLSREEALRAADENFRLLEAEYRIGLATNIELVAAQQELTAARLAYELERLDAKRLALDLRFLTGGASNFGEAP